jgi:hypothetical protein
MKKTIWIIIGAVVIAVAFAAGGFYGGMTYAKNQVSQVQAQFFRERGGNPPTGGFPGANGTAFPGGAQGFFGGNTTGVIKTMDGNTLTVTTARNTITVTMNDATKVEKTQPGAASDLQTGQQVIVMGQRDANGNVTATQILILPVNPAQSTPGATP